MDRMSTVDIPQECNHSRGPLSTLSTRYVHDGCDFFMWQTSCTSCGKQTDWYLTEREATARAIAGWWNAKYMEDGEEIHIPGKHGANAEMGDAYLPIGTRR